MGPERAKELIKLIDWEAGDCLCIGNPKPDYAQETADERAEITAMWKTMAGYTCYWDALNRIAYPKAD